MTDDGRGDGGMTFFTSLGGVLYRLGVVVAVFCIGGLIVEGVMDESWNAEHWLEWLIGAAVALIAGRLALWIFAGR